MFEASYETFFIAQTETKSVIVCSKYNNPIQDCELTVGTKVTDLLIDNPQLSDSEVETFRQNLDKQLIQAFSADGEL